MDDRTGDVTIRQYNLGERVRIRPQASDLVFDRRVYVVDGCSYLASDANGPRCCYKIHDLEDDRIRTMLDVQLEPAGPPGTASTSEILAGILAVTRETALPRVIGSRTIDGAVVTVVEQVMPILDGEPQRGFRWDAFVGGYVLDSAAVDDDGTCHAGEGRGNLIATSTTSSDAAFADASQALQQKAA